MGDEASRRARGDFQPFIDAPVNGAYARWMVAARSLGETRLANLLRPMSGPDLHALMRRAEAARRQFHGNTMRMFAPLYLSNECVNNCSYCGFSRDNPILRVTLLPEQVEAEVRHLAGLGFRSILLVAGEHPKFVSNGYLETCISIALKHVPSVSIEVGPMEEEEYRPLVRAGAEGLVVYQETYDRETYAIMHTAGPKRDFDWRMACPERGYAAGFKRIGIGALLGLHDWRMETIALAEHLEHLLRVCWKAMFTISFPRLRPAAGGFQPRHAVSDSDFCQLLAAMRVAFPQVGQVLSTREPAALRDALAPITITHMSAGSHTEPGGYTGQGKEELHLTVRGRRQELDESDKTGCATGQFSIADERSPVAVAEMLRGLGIEAVWKDWDHALAVTND